MYFKVTYIRYSGAFSLFLFIYFSWLCWEGGVVHINSWGRLEVSGGCGRRILHSRKRDLIRHSLSTICNHPVTMENWKLGVGSGAEYSVWSFQGSSAICTPLAFVDFWFFFFPFCFWSTLGANWCSSVARILRT